MRKSASDRARAIRSVLESAAEGAALVRVQRRGMPRWPRDCFVVAVSSRLALLQPVADRLDLDGYALVRLQDVTEAAPSPKAQLLHAAFLMKEVAYEPPARIDLTSMRTAVQAISESYGVIVARRERASRSECEIGQIAQLRARTYQLRWLTPTAEFEADERWFRLAEVTMIQFDGEYENTLAALAGVVPPVPTGRRTVSVRRWKPRPGFRARRT
jgi:hypothetical protein